MYDLAMEPQTMVSLDSLLNQCSMLLNINCSVLVQELSVTVHAIS